MLDATIWGAALALFTMPLFGMLGDRIGHKWVFMAGAVGILACAPLFFSWLGTGDKAWIVAAVCVAVGLVYACLYGPEGTLFSSQFPAHVRYTGISLAVQVSGAIGGGLAPIVATWLLAQGAGSPKYVVWYLSILGVIALFSAWRMRSEAAAAPAMRVPAAADLRTP
jgi:MFS family permease